MIDALDVFVGDFVENISNKNKVTIVLTGGRTVLPLYRRWRDYFSQMHSCEFEFYFGDERCVSASHAESNYNSAVSALFPDGVPDNCRVFRIEGEDLDRKAAADRYSDVFPEEIDLLLLSVGEDGHIASLFPGDKDSIYSDSLFVPVLSHNKKPYNRISMTSKVIDMADKVVVLVSGQEKGKVLRMALEDPNDIVNFPVRLTVGKNWFLDQEASRSLTEDNNQFDDAGTTIFLS